MPAPTFSPAARALGRVPTGLYIVTADAAGSPAGFVGSFVMQVGFEPPTVCVAIGNDRAQLANVRESGYFGVSVLDARTEGVMNRFFKRTASGRGPFDGLAWSRAKHGSPVLDDVLAWLECRVTGEHATGDHVVVFGEVVDAKLVREGEPSIRLRANGLAY
jgi:flavin reductase (DIM6/NTAB) family NADH-FMN oxidoreductase RutF